MQLHKRQNLHTFIFLGFQYCLWANCKIKRILLPQWQNVLFKSIRCLVCRSIIDHLPPIIPEWAVRVSPVLQDHIGIMVSIVQSIFKHIFLPSAKVFCVQFKSIHLYFVIYMSTVLQKNIKANWCGVNKLALLTRTCVSYVTSSQSGKQLQDSITSKSSIILLNALSLFSPFCHARHISIPLRSSGTGQSQGMQLVRDEAFLSRHSNRQLSSLYCRNTLFVSYHYAIMDARSLHFFHTKEHTSIS